MRLHHLALTVLVLTGGLSGTALAQTASHEEIVDACLAASNMPEPICTCVADKLMEEEISDTQRLWYYTSLTDQEAAEALVSEMSPVEAAQIGMFSATAPAQCAAGG
ncbi:hypothetical protein [Cucumibacter marinus]|uniref:hypothetical protein n=1 Tax=Cucumibacter marinus TaxID=1121252 RepID=UPI0003FBEB21|nr:hypothetical protein [Cucumibacter marinus]